MLPIRDVSLFVKVLGDGDPLVLMHGGPGLDHSTLRALEPLADRFTLIFYDHRCNGRSTGTLESMTWENLTADADALRCYLGFEQWAVLGQSFGGMVALEYALRYPARVSHLALLDTWADAFWVQHVAPEILAKRGYDRPAVNAARRFFSGHLAPADVYRLVRKFVGAYYYHLGPMSAARALFSGLRVKMRADTHVFGFRELYTGWTVMDRLDEIDAPTLVLAGRHDFLSPSEHDAIITDRMPNATLEIIERAGHNAHDERPAEVLRALRRFLTMPRAAPAGYGIGVARSRSTSATMPRTMASASTRPFSRVASVALPYVPVRDHVFPSRTAAAESRVRPPAPG